MNNERVREVIEKDFAIARKLINELEAMAYQPDLFFEYQRDMIEYNLKDCLFRLRQRLIAEFDRLGMGRICENIVEETSGYNKNPAEFEDVSWADCLSNPFEWKLSEFYEILVPYLPQNNFNSEAEYAYQNLLKILKGTPFLMHRKKIDPKNEKDVELAVYETLELLFPDAVRQIPIPKSAKTYKPDIGIRSLKTIIEYKFADTEQELKSCLDGIYTDIHGYAGSNDWTRFIAVIYMTAPFITLDKFETMCRECDIPDNWNMLMVQGTGKRKKKANSPASPATPSDPQAQ